MGFSVSFPHSGSSESAWGAACAFCLGKGVTRPVPGSSCFCEQEAHPCHRS